MSIGIFCALKEEADPLLKRLNIRQVNKHRGWTLYRTRLGSQEIFLALTGPGQKNVRRAAEEFFSILQPTHVIIYGFAGGLDPSLVVGDLVLCHQILASDIKVRKVYPCDLLFANSVFQDWSGPSRIIEGNVLTSPRVIGTRQEKKRLYEERKVHAVDMETWYIAGYTQKKNIPITVLRAITDSSEETLDIDFNRFLKNGGGIKVFSLIIYVLLHPSKIKSLLRLGKASQKAGAQLSDFIFQILYSLS